MFRIGPTTRQDLRRLGDLENGRNEPRSNIHSLTPYESLAFLRLVPVLQRFGNIWQNVYNNLRQQTRLTASHSKFNKFTVHLHSSEVTQYLQAIWQVSSIYTMKSDLLQLHLVAAMVVASHITAYFEYESTHVYCLPNTNSWESVCPDLADSTLHDRPPSREIALLAIGEPWGRDPRGCHGTQKFQRWIMNRIRSFHWELLTISHN